MLGSWDETKNDFRYLSWTLVLDLLLLLKEALTGTRHYQSAKRKRECESGNEWSEICQLSWYCNFANERPSAR